MRIRRKRHELTPQPETENRRDVPDAAETVLTKPGKPMSENTVSRAEFERVVKQSQRRKAELDALTKERDDLKSQLQTAISERDEAVKGVEEIRQAYQEFTNENEIYRELETLKADMKLRDMADMLNGLDGIEYQQGVTLADVLEAAGIDPGEIDEIPEDFGTKVIEAARASKPFLFAAQAPAQGEAAKTPGDVRPQAAQTAPTLKAFGAQAVGGGSAPPGGKPDPAKSVDWTDPAAINAFVASRDA